MTVVAKAFLGCAVLSLVIGCASGTQKPKPVDLAPMTELLKVRLAWSAKVAPSGFPMNIQVVGNTMMVAGSDGSVISIDAQTGDELWRASIGSPILAGVGSDGRVTAVLTRGNELVAMEGGREIWRQKMTSPSFTSPLVAGGRVFLLSADRSVNAFDGQSGRKLWSLQRPGEPLVLRQAGVLLAVGDTLLAGLSGRLVGINPLNGTVLWESPIAVPRGTNDIERLVDLVGRVSRDGAIVCARAFQAAVGCVNTERGTLLWTRPANGFVGIHGDGTYVFGAESDGKLLAWRQSDGERVWQSERLQYRGLTAPLVVGRSVAVGDEAGFVHLMSREDGTLLTRLVTDGSAIAAAPVLAGQTLIVVTRNGGIFGFKPE